MKKIYFFISILLITTHLFAQKLEISEGYSDKNRPKYGPFYDVNFTANTLVIDTFSIGLLNWYGENVLKGDTDFIKKYNVVMVISTCPKEAKSVIGVQRAKIIIDYFHYKYGINRKYFFIRGSNIVKFDSWCKYSPSYIGLGIDYKKEMNASKDSLFQTIHFGFKSLLIDNQDIASLDSLGTMLVKNYPEMTDTASSQESHDIYLMLHSCTKETDSFIGVERAKMIIEYLYDNYKIKRNNFLLQISDSSTEDCHHPTIDIVFYLPPQSGEEH